MDVISPAGTYRPKGTILIVRNGDGIGEASRRKPLHLTTSLPGPPTGGHHFKLPALTFAGIPSTKPAVVRTCGGFHAIAGK